MKALITILGLFLATLTFSQDYFIGDPWFESTTICFDRQCDSLEPLEMTFLVRSDDSTLTIVSDTSEIVIHWTHLDSDSTYNPGYYSHVYYASQGRYGVSYAFFERENDPFVTETVTVTHHLYFEADTTWKPIRRFYFMNNALD